MEVVAAPMMLGVTAALALDVVVEEEIGSEAEVPDETLAVVFFEASLTVLSGVLPVVESPPLSSELLSPFCGGSSEAVGRGDGGGVVAGATID